MRNLHHAANLHLSKENDFWPELAPYKMMIPGAKNCYPSGVRQTGLPYVKLWRNVLFQAHLGEVSLQDYVFSGEAGIVMKNEMILSINLHYHDFFAAKLIVCKDKFTYTMTSFPLFWDDYDLTRLHCNKGLVAILLTKKAEVESYQQYL